MTDEMTSFLRVVTVLIVPSGSLSCVTTLVFLVVVVVCEVSVWTKRRGD